MFIILYVGYNFIFLFILRLIENRLRIIDLLDWKNTEAKETNILISLNQCVINQANSKGLLLDVAFNLKISLKNYMN